MRKDYLLSTFVFPILTSIVGGILLSYISLLIPLNGKYETDYILLWARILLVFSLSFLIILYIISKYKTKTKPIKVIVFDFDGTLTYNNGLRSSWEKIWVHLGYKVQDCQEYYNQFKEGKIDHSEWCKITCKAFKNKQMSRGTLESVSKDIQLMDGAKEVLYKMKNEDHLKLYIVSGSIIQLIEYVWGDNIDDYFEGYNANILLFHRNNMLARIIGTEFDFAGKAEYIKKIAKDEKLKSTSEILFIGNSDNDEYAYRSGAQTLCFNPKLTNVNNKKIWHRHYRADSFHDLYNYIKKSYLFEE
ncbi:HAD family hydrolase [Parabacteroides pacaensis]|uniref:HAD family hydrolase n=1 Tax=Parabacteroides pacaensis TaxID=2086575 RepID=UPI00131C7956|nr:HAD family hydrolase [Parabacteroides pacaensis]